MSSQCAEHSGLDLLRERSVVGMVNVAGGLWSHEGLKAARVVRNGSIVVNTQEQICIVRFGHVGASSETEILIRVPSHNYLDVVTSGGSCGLYCIANQQAESECHVLFQDPTGSGRVVG